MMSPSQVGAVLELAASFDGRSLTPTLVEHWHGTIGDLDYDETCQAVREFYRTSGKWIMPANIRHILAAKSKPNTMSPKPAEEAPYRGVPMPDHIKALLAERWGSRESLADERAKTTARGPEKPVETIEPPMPYPTQDERITTRV